MLAQWMPDQCLILQISAILCCNILMMIMTMIMIVNMVIMIVYSMVMVISIIIMIIIVHNAGLIDAHSMFDS